MGPETAVIVPCLHGEVAIARVVDAFRERVPGRVPFLYDNDSTGRTAEVVRLYGAVMRREPPKGTGRVVRPLIANVEMVIDVMVGDAA